MKKYGSLTKNLRNVKEEGYILSMRFGNRHLTQHIKNILTYY